MSWGDTLNQEYGNSVCMQKVASPVVHLLVPYYSLLVSIGGFMKRFFAMAMAFALVSCGGAYGPSLDAPSRFGELELRYGPCFGTCPVFSVTLNQNGSLVYEGDRFVTVTGRERRQIGAGAFEEVVRLIESLPETELVDPLQCPRRHTDAKTVRGNLKFANRDIDIMHYYGCGGYEYRRRQVQLIREITDILQIDDLVGWDPNRITR
ncbi:MAG: DUF6438 domain-containing protein [Kordiimonas sp.]